MDWRHEVSEQWLEARKNYLTATELASCTAAWKRINKQQLAGNEIFPAFAKLWAKKQSSAPVDAWSKGPAARGHILEPYAVDDWNKSFPDKPMYHWDDCIIALDPLGWSPDALDVPQETSLPVIHKDGNKLTDGVHKFKNERLPNSFLEIKSYEPNKIIECRMKNRMQLDERWQIACGFWVLDSIEEANLLFYSIDTDLSFYVTYTREDLKEELDQISDMVSVWLMNSLKLVKLPNEFTRTHTEEEVYDDYIEAQQDVFMF